MHIAIPTQFLVCISTMSLLVGGVFGTVTTTRRERAVQILERELRNDSGWVQIHAADALLDHGMTQEVNKVFASIADVPPDASRIGVWRVMARAARTDPLRAAFVEKIRRVLHDPNSSDRLQAAESLAKLGASERSDSETLTKWLDNTGEAVAPYPLWLLVLSSPKNERESAEASLANLLNSTDSLARLRTAYALGRLKSIAEATYDRLCEQLKREPADSPARVYLVAAALLHARENEAFVTGLKRELNACLTNREPNEQLEAATVLGMRGDEENLPALTDLLSNSAPDARIGAANGLLYLLP